MYTLTHVVAVSFAGAISLTSGSFVEEHAPLLVNDIHCNGSESTLLACDHNRLTNTNCGPLEDAGVLCQRMSIKA